jgi:addiction module HigA family antidote
MTDKLEIVETLPPMHPGEVLREEFMEPLGLTAGKVAKACGIPRNRIELIARERLGISGDTALRLGRLFGTSAELWMNLQKRYELESARRAIGSQIDSVQEMNQAAV